MYIRCVLLSCTELSAGADFVHKLYDVVVILKMDPVSDICAGVHMEPPPPPCGKYHLPFSHVYPTGPFFMAVDLHIHVLIICYNC